jgi:uncharacterized repeat protein (TIGR03803 family)
MREISTILIACALGWPLLGPTAKASSEKVLYSFCSQANCTDGEQPFAALVEADGTLYGTAFNGGNGAGCSGGCGTAYLVSLKDGTEKTLYAFCSLQDCVDGALPDGSLIDVKRTLYGTTAGSGAGRFGTVFSLDRQTGTESVIRSFENSPDGAVPTANVIDAKGTLYGTTSDGGSHGYGAIFSLNTKTGAESVIYSFCSLGNCADGAHPVAGLIDAKAMLYGTTTIGGAKSHGTVFSFDLKTGTEAVLYSFCGLQRCADGDLPEGGLVDVAGVLYGTTVGGGTGSGCSGGCGTAFQINLNTGAEKTAYSFCSQQNCTDGKYPAAALLAVNGSLLGTTFGGGARAGGTVFTIEPDTGNETVTYSFCSQQNCTDGEVPQAALIDVKGVLYGTTSAGGAHGVGTVFSVTP